MRTIITPDMAREILENNKRNRPIKKSSLLFIEEQIKNKKFVYNGSTIVISDKGELVDGQHRLTACVNTNISIEVELIKGVDFEVFKTIDTGKPRSGSDVFAINGIASSTNISSICNKCIDVMGLNRKAIKENYIKNSNDDLLRFYKSHQEQIDTAYRLSSTLYQKTKMLPPSFSSSMILVLNRYIGDNRGGAFIRQIFNGVQETDSNIPIVIRERLIKDAMSNSGKLSSNQKRNMIINGFKSYVDAKSYKQVPSNAYNNPKEFNITW